MKKLYRAKQQGTFRNLLNLEKGKTFILTYYNEKDEKVLKELSCLDEININEIK